MSKLARLTYLGLGRETVLGVPVAPTVYLPIVKDSYKPHDKIAAIRDESLRANASILQGQYGGASESENSFAGMLYPDTAGHLFRMLGLLDTPSAGTNGRTVHSLKASSAQPSTWTHTDFDGFETRAFPGQLLSELALKIDVAQGAAMYEAKAMGWPSAVAATPTPSYGVVQPFLGWQLTWSAGGIASTKVLSTEMTFKRDVEVIHASDGTQGPRETFADGLDFSGSFKALFEDNSDLEDFLAYSVQAVTATLTAPGASGASIAITSTSTVFSDAQIDRAGKYLTLDVPFDGIHSIADAGPAQVVLTNSVAAAY